MKRALIVALTVGILVACSGSSEDEASCATLSCGAHGTCTLTGGTASCTCSPGYVGPACDACAPGFERTAEGLCSSSCAQLTCGPHERCTDVGGVATCACVTGYSIVEDGGGCVFTGGPVDPGFDNPQPNGWQTRNAATVDPGNPTDIEGGRGWARFSGFGEVYQTFEMPAYADAEPLALELDLRCSRFAQCTNVLPVFSVLLGEHPTDLWDFGSEPTTKRVCLGDRAFGGNITLGIRTHPSSQATPTPGGDRVIGRAQFAPSATCAAPGTVKNGDFEAGEWTISSERPAVDIIEEGGNHRARLRSSCAAEDLAISSITSSISIPRAFTRPAVTFSIEGTAAGSTRLTLDGQLVGTVRGTGAKEKAVVCLSPSTAGFAFDLGIEAVADPSCAPGKSNVVIVDDFAVTSEPACDDRPVPNGDFEAAVDTGWDGQGFEIVEDPAAAHSGGRYLELRASCPGGATVYPWVATVPMRDPSKPGGAALKMWYRLPAGVRLDLSAGDVLGLEARHRLDPAESWTEKVTCLSGHVWGRRVRILVDLYSTSPEDGSCVAEPAVFQLDDVSIGPDPSCPDG